MSFEVHMLIMYHVHLLSTKVEGKKPTKVPNSTPKILTRLLLYSKYRMSSITGKIMHLSAVAKKSHLHSTAEIEKETGIPFSVPPCGKGIHIRWQHLIFFNYLYYSSV